MGNLRDVAHRATSTIIWASLLAVATFVAPRCAAASAPTVTCDMRLLGTSAFHRIAGHMAPVAGVVVPGTHPGTWNTSLSIPIASITTDDEERDAKLRKILHADTSPLIQVEISGLDPAAARDVGVLEAEVTIGAVTRKVPVMVSNWQKDGARVSFDAFASLSIEEFDLDVPSMLGLLRVADKVLVDANVVVDHVPDEPVALRAPRFTGNAEATRG